MSQSKVIFHLDFDSFFVSVHRAYDHSLDNKPIAITKNLRRSIASSISYELKNLGIKPGWPIFKIMKFEPKTICIEPNYNLYIKMSAKIFEFIAKKFTKSIEVFSIDECWIDVTELINEGRSPIELALEMQQAIKKEFNIPASFGISHTKFLAKLSTNLAKPFGIKWTKNEDLKNDIWPLPIIEYFGVGKPTAERLIKIGIRTIGDLANWNIEDLKLNDIFRSRTLQHINEAKGFGNDQLIYAHNELKNIGNEVSFLSDDIDDEKELLKLLKKLSQKVSFRARNRNQVGYVISVNLRSVEKNWQSKQKRIKFATNDENVIYENARKLFQAIWNNEYIRGIGVRLSELENEFNIGQPTNLFEEEIEQDNQGIKMIIKNINWKFKNKILKTGEQFEKELKKENAQLRYLEEDTLEEKELEWK